MSDFIVNVTSTDLVDRGPEWSFDEIYSARIGEEEPIVIDDEERAMHGTTNTVVDMQIGEDKWAPTFISEIVLLSFVGEEDAHYIGERNFRIEIEECINLGPMQAGNCFADDTKVRTLAKRRFHLGGYSAPFCFKTVIGV